MVDSNFSLYICDQYNSRIQKWTPNATSGITVAGLSNGTSGYHNSSLNSPNGVVIDTNGDLYIADTTAHRVQYWARGATFGVTVAGTGK